MSRLTHKRLLEYISYDPDTGIFIRLKLGKRADLLDEWEGYRRVWLFDKNYRAHRLAWFYMTGTWPKQGIDHKNGIRSDNRWNNIREADQSWNNQNRYKAARHNKTGYLGVSRVPSPPGTFVATIRVNKKKFHLGNFKTAELAYSAYLDAKRRLHPAGML